MVSLTDFLFRSIFGHYSQIIDIQIWIRLLTFIAKSTFIDIDCLRMIVRNTKIWFERPFLLLIISVKTFLQIQKYIIFRSVCSDGLGRTLLPTQPLLPTSHFGLCKRTKPGGMEMKETQLKIEWEAPELAIVHYRK